MIHLSEYYNFLFQLIILIQIICRQFIHILMSHPFVREVKVLIQSELRLFNLGVLHIEPKYLVQALLSVSQIQQRLEMTQYQTRGELVFQHASFSVLYILVYLQTNACTIYILGNKRYIPIFLYRRVDYSLGLQAVTFCEI